MTTYLKNYCKEITPRYYKQEVLYIITRDKNLFEVTCKGLRILGFKFKIEIKDKDYIIRGTKNG